MNFFTPQGFQAFAANYPEVPHTLAHTLCNHPMMELEALACLAERLPAKLIEYASSNQPIGVDEKPAAPTIPVGEAIRNIETSGCWVALTFIEHDPAYRALMDDVIGELRQVIEPKTGRILKPSAFFFITSPSGVTPYHFDPEHNILLQIRGSKVMTQFPAGDPAYAPSEVHETYHTGGPRELKWRDELASGGIDLPISAGEGVFVPVMAPHFVRNGPDWSISFAVTWRSEWSYAEADAHAFNAALRRIGMTPRRPGPWPARNRAKALSWRVLRKLGVAG